MQLIAIDSYIFYQIFLHQFLLYKFGLHKIKKLIAMGKIAPISFLPSIKSSVYEGSYIFIVRNIMSPNIRNEIINNITYMI